MARKLELTWMSGSKRWKKYRAGKVYYFPFGSSKADMGGYQKALEAWKKIEAQLDSEADAAKPGREAYERAIALHREKLEFWRQFGGPEDQKKVEAYQDKIEELQLRLSMGTPPPITYRDIPVEDEFSSPESRATWKERRRILGNAKTRIEAGRSISENIDLFLARKRSHAEAGELSKGRCDIIRLGLDRFGKFYGADRSIDELDGDALLTFRDHLLTLAARKEFSRVYARDCLGTVCQWIRWLWTSGRIEHLPRAIGSKDLQIAVGNSKIETFEIDEIKSLLSEASDRTKLYMLLALNCGMTQKDISDLQKSEIDLKKGIIRRKRSKTSKEESVPEVAYHLWPETLEILKAEISDHKQVALTNANGGPLWSQEIKANGKLAKNDNIKTAYYRLVSHKKLKHLKGKAFKLFRKTSATMLGKHKDFKNYAPYFLGHAPRSVADRHYIVPSSEEFRKALTWLGQQYGLK